MSRCRRSSLSSAYEEKNVKMLRISASDVAAIAGYHQWVDVRDLFLERLLYQGLGHVLDADADNLGLEVEDRRQRSERLLVKSGDGELQAIRERAGSAAAVATVRDAKALKDKTKTLLKKAEAEKKLSREEARELEDELHHDINTQFGTRNEEAALRVYERRSGTQVMCSNDRILIWPFPGTRHGDDIPDGALEPPAELAMGWDKSRGRQVKRARLLTPAAVPAAADPDASFAPAVARCLAELPVRAILEGVIERVLSRARDTNVTVTNSDREKVYSSTLYKDDGAGGVIAGDIAGCDHRHKTEKGNGFGRSRAADGTQGHKESASRGVSTRQLARAAPWPEWRASATNQGEEAIGGGVKSRWCGQSGLWFPRSLTPQQQGTVRAVASELGLRHDLVTVEYGTRQVVVWEGSTASAQIDFAAKVAVVVTSEAPRPAKRASSSPSSTQAVDPSTCIRSAASVHCCASVRGERGASHTLREGRPLVHRPDVVPVAEPGRKSAGHLGSKGGARFGSESRRSCSVLCAPVDGSEALDALDGDVTEVGGASEVSRRSSEVEEAPAAALEGLAVKDQTKVENATSGRTATTATVAAAESPDALDRHHNGDIGRGDGCSGKGDSIDSAKGNNDGLGVGFAYAWGEGPVAAGMESEESCKTNLATTTNRRPSVWSREPKVGSPEAETIVADLPRVQCRLSITEFPDGKDQVGEMERVGSGRSDAGREGGKTVNSRGDKRREACFVIAGAVDGVAEELTAASEDADTWETQKVVVEVKNRMDRAMDPPPLYDQIQLVTYMLMIGATVGDLVQFVKTRSKKGCGPRRSLPAGETVLDNAPARSAVADEQVTISRVELHCRRYNHKRHWQETILPRLYAFARMVYRFRSDDLLRWRYLLSNPEEQRTMLVECCPYLDGVIRSNLPRPLSQPFSSLRQAIPTPSDKASLEQAEKYVDTTTCPSEPPAGNSKDNAESQQNKERVEALMGGIEKLESPPAATVIATAAVLSPVRKKAKGEEGLALEPVGVSQGCGGK